MSEWDAENVATWLAEDVGVAEVVVGEETKLVDLHERKQLTDFYSLDYVWCGATERPRTRMFFVSLFLLLESI